MRRKLALILVVPIAVVVTAGSGAATQQKPPCSARGSSTIYRDRDVRVYDKTTGYGTGTLVTETYACGFDVDKPRRIAYSEDDGSWSSSEDASSISVKRPWMGYAVDGGAKGESPWGRACALNLETGKRRCYSALLTFAVGITRNGSVAWMDLPDGEYLKGVHKSDAGTPRSVLLDSGRDIDTDSFAVGGTHIYWTNAGATKSATMP